MLAAQRNELAMKTRAGDEEGAVPFNCRRHLVRRHVADDFEVAEKCATRVDLPRTLAVASKFPDGIHLEPPFNPNVYASVSGFAIKNSLIK